MPVNQKKYLNMIIMEQQKLFHFRFEYNIHMKVILLAILLSATVFAQIDPLINVATDPLPLPNSAASTNAIGSAASGSGSPSAAGCNQRPDPSKCSLTEKWDPTTQQCVPRCIDTVLCTANRVWSPIFCTCVCAASSDCPPGSSWNRQSCLCEFRANSASSLPN